MHNSCCVKVDHCVRYVKFVCYRYSPGGPMLPVAALEQRRVVESRGCVRSFN